MLAPRAHRTSSVSGFSWTKEEAGLETPFEAMIPAVELLLENLPKWLQELDLPQDLPLHLLGFSQGAALSYTLAITHPERVALIAGLSGFIPQGAENYLIPASLHDVPVFIAHGSKDDIVPVEWARSAVQTLKSIGAQTIYCEEEVGHKLSLPCLRALEKFFKSQAIFPEPG